MIRSAVFLLSLACVPQAGAATLRLCVDERPWPPYLMPSGDGMAQRLLRDAAREAGATLAAYAAPVTRCREEIRYNAADGFPIAPYTPALLSFMVFPMRGGEPDPARAVMSARTLAYRRTGSAVQWDGVRFTHLATPVLVRFGSVLMVDKLAAMDVQADDSGKMLSANFSKLLAGRADIAVGLETTGLALLALPEFAGKIEALPVPFTDEAYYLGLSRTFYNANPQLSERLWDAIARQRRSPAYQHALRKALDDTLKGQKD
jgi:polar amino acid transport system substrate-binding protein